MTPGQVIAIITGLCLFLILIRAFWEPRQLRTTQVRLYEEPSDKETMDKKTASLSILFISDLHQDQLKIKESKLLSAVKQHRPDIVLFGGDLTAKPACLDSAVSLLARIHESASSLSLPLIAVRGNHDKTESITAMEQAGFVVLRNEGYRFSCRGKHYQIVGLDDPTAGTPDAALPLREAELAGIPPSQRLILTHNPDNVLTLPPGQARFFFAGHFHGGQIYMPFGLEFRLLRHEQFLRFGLYKGQVQWRDLTGFITRGLGCVLIPLRLHSLPEIAIIDLFLSDTKQY